ncbi:UNVERIFIED_CONTAM: NAD+ glycohydrolase toxin immunity protein [Acetivibrio alkalicellulosi]
MEINTMVEGAIKTDSLKEMLEGKNHFQIKNSHLSNLTTPADYIRILKEGIYKIYIEGDRDILGRLEETLKIMICEDLFGLYCALEAIYIQLMFEQNRESPFNININELIPLLKDTIVKNKDKLIRYYDWAGRNEIDGMYGYFERMNRAFVTYYGYSIL